MAVLDVWLQAQGTSLAAVPGAVADQVPCGVSVGIAASAEAMPRRSAAISTRAINGSS
jgi:hypothetical protein